MLTFRNGTPGGVEQAAAYTAHLLERTLPADQQALADEHARLTPVDAAMMAEMGSIPRPMPDMAPEVAEALGIDPTRALTQEELGNLLGGKRTDGATLPGSQRDVRVYRQADGTERHRSAWTDLCFSAPKSVSLAWAFADTEAERQAIHQAHTDAVQEMVRYIQHESARAGFGHGREGEAEESGKIGAVLVNHFTARSTVEVVRDDPTTGVPSTELYTVGVAGDPDIHTHAIIPNLMVTESGRVLSIDSGRIAGRFKEYGATYQAVLGRNLARIGIHSSLDEKTGLLRLNAIPDAAVREFSKRTDKGELAAADYAQRKGLVWANMQPGQKAAMLKAAIKLGRQGQGDDLADMAAWRRQAVAIGWQHRSAEAYGPEAPARSERDRIAEGWSASLPGGEALLKTRAVVTGSDLRLTAVRGLIARGMESLDDISAVTRRYVKDGVRQDGKWTQLIIPGGDRARPERARVTTHLHRDEEAELIGRVRRAAQRPDGAISRKALSAALVAKDMPRLSPEQLKGVERLAGAGRFAMVIGGAGVGKTTLLKPVIAAAKADGYEVWGTALANRQSRALGEAGVHEWNQKALDPLLDKIARSPERFGPQTLVVMDEIGMVGTRQALQLLRLQAQLGFKLVAVGDDRQCQAIEAGPLMNLLGQALGEDSVPAVVQTVRQRLQSERELVAMFREGRIKEAIDIKRADGTATLVPGGYDAIVQRTAALWAERLAAGKTHTPDYAVAVLAPTNADAMAISTAIRGIRRGTGEVAPADTVILKARDQVGNTYDLPLAEGDRVRLFVRTRAMFKNQFGGRFEGNIGDNGSVLMIRQILPDRAKGGLVMETKTGAVGFVSWNKLSTDQAGRIQLAYGDALTVFTAQGLTADEGILSMPSGSHAVNLYQALVGASRHRIAAHIVGSEGAELRQVEAERDAGLPALGTAAERTEAMWANVTANLSRAPVKESALTLLGRMQAVGRAARDGMVRGRQQQAQRQQRGLPPSTGRRQAMGMRQAAALRPVVAQLEMALRQQTQVITALQQGPRPQPAPTPSRTPRAFRVQLTEHAAQDQFADAMRAAGLRVTSPPIMDGTRRYVAVEGNKGNDKSGAYKGFYDAGVPNGIIWNYKAGTRSSWKATGEMVPVSAEEQAAARDRTAATRAAAIRQQGAREDAAAQKAAWILEGTRPATPANAYLREKGMTDIPKGLREDLRGNIIVPLSSVDGTLRNLQTIIPGGRKLYLPDAQKSGTGFVVGPMRHDMPLGIAEGLATGWSAHKASGMPVLVALDTSNLKHAAAAVRSKAPDKALVFFADNDHHLSARPKPLPNAGLEKASEAADDLGNARVIAPPLDAARHAADKGTDWNDHMMKHGVAATAERARAGLATSQPSPSRPAPAAPPIRSPSVPSPPETGRQPAARGGRDRSGPRMAR